MKRLVYPILALVVIVTLVTLSFIRSRPGAPNRGDVGDSQAPPTASKAQRELRWKIVRDDAGRVAKLLDPAGRVTSFSYETDGLGRVVKIRKASEGRPETALEFDRFGRRSAMTDGLGSVRYEHDGLGRLTAVHRGGAPTLAYSYDALNRLTRVSLGARLSVRYNYDFLGRVESIETPVGKIAYEYWPSEGVIDRTLPNGIRTRWRYHVDGVLESITHADASGKVLARFTCEYRPDGLTSHVREWSPRGEKTIRYEYDTVRRLVAVDDSELGKTTYEYGRLGNRKVVRAPGTGEVASEHDWAGRLVRHAGADCRHDLAGNLTEYTGATGKVSLSYTADGQLESVGAGDGKVAYAYDGDGNLVRRAAGADETSYVPDPLADIWRPLLAVEKSGKQTFYVWHGGAPLAAITDGEPSFFLHGRLGEVRSVTDQTGSVVSRTEYSPFGAPDGPARPGALSPGFAGLFHDPQTGLCLTRTRAYDPRLGRFLQIDPVHRVPFGAQKDLVAYAYCGNDPVNYVDRDGAEPLPFQIDQRGTVKVPDLPPVVQSAGNGAAWVQQTVRRIGEAITPEFSVNTSLGFTGRSSTLVPGTSLTEDRRTLSTSVGVGISLTWGDKPQPGAGVTSIDLGLGEHLGISLNSFTDSRGAEGRALSLNLGVGIGPPVGVTYNFPADNYLVDQGQVRKGLLGGNDAVIRPSRGFGPFLSAAPDRGPFLRAGDGNAGGLLGGTGATIGPPASSALSTSPVGGVRLTGAGKLLEDFGQLEGVALINGRLVLIAAEQGTVKLPPLHLDDVVTVFRSVYEHGDAYVSIDPDMKDPHGPVMHIRLAPGLKDTYVGWVLFEADRVMKAYSLGADNVTKKPVKSAIEGYSNLLELGANDAGAGLWERFWIVPASVRRLKSSANEVTLLDVPLILRTEAEVLKEGKFTPRPGASSPAATAFTRWFSARYDALCKESRSTPPDKGARSAETFIFQELRRVTLLVAIAEALRDQGVPMPDWMRDYPVQHFRFPGETPSLTVSQTTQEGKRTVKRSIYGGVSLVAPSREVRTETASQKADALLPELVRATATSQAFAPVKFEVGGKRYRAFALPSRASRRVGACRLEETDLAIPVRPGVEVKLTRAFHSFQAPSGAFGRGWALELPRLERRRRPVTRTESETSYRTVYELVSPLFTYAESFSELRDVAEVGGKLLTPNMPGAMLGVRALSDGTTVLLFRDGRRWSFDEEGNLSASEDGLLVVFFKYNASRQFQRIEGRWGKELLAAIDLAYDSSGRLESASGSNGAKARYRYNKEGQLDGVERRDGSWRYRYAAGLVSEVLESGLLVRRLEYGSDGVLRRDWRRHGGETGYDVSVNPFGTRVTATHCGDTRWAEVVDYDEALRPRRWVLADGTLIRWRYAGVRLEEIVVTSPDGEECILRVAADGSGQTWHTAEGGRYAVRLDRLGRESELLLGEETLARQEWRQDGLTSLVVLGGTWFHPLYSKEGERKGLLVTPPGKGPRFDRWLQVEHDAAGRPSALADYTRFRLSLSYDKHGLPAHLKSERGSVDVKRGERGRVEEVLASWGFRLKNTFSEAGDLTRTDLTQRGGTASMEFAGGRLAKVQQFDGGETSLECYDRGPDEGRLRAITTPNGLGLRYEYTAQGVLGSVACDNTYRVTYVLDGKGRLEELVLSPERK